MRMVLEQRLLSKAIREHESCVFPSLKRTFSKFSSVQTSPPGLTDVIPTINWPWSLCLLLEILKTLLIVGH